MFAGRSNGHKSKPSPPFGVTRHMTQDPGEIEDYELAPTG